MGASHGHEIDILVGEDNDINRMVFEYALEPEHYRALFAKTGEQVLAFASRHRPRLILMDIHLPDMSGLDAIRAIRAEGERDGWRPYILAVTAYVEMNNRKDCLAAGADDYMAKPFSPAILVQHVRSVLGDPVA